MSSYFVVNLAAEVPLWRDRCFAAWIICLTQITRKPMVTPCPDA